MRSRVLVVLVFAAMVLQLSAAAVACGDKFLMLGRGVKFQRAYAAIYPASIVIYAQPQRHAAKAIRDPRLQNELKLAGHRVSVVETEAALTHALDSERIDLILADVADTDRVLKQAEAAPGKPGVLPVMYQPTKQEAKAIEQQCNCRLTASDRADRYLRTIDDAMKARVQLKKGRRS